MSPVKKRAVSVVVVALGACLLAALLIVGVFAARPRVEAYLYSTTFDSAAWKARSLDGNFGWPTRLRMADDLLGRHLLDNATRAQVEDLLGPADKTSYSRQWDFVYKLGPERGFIAIDYEWLVIRIDQSGRVAEYRVVRD
jgi:hypothetical protein